jgi:Rrf2 family iron-sulfur cluster assembly transcriptional regulator
MLRFSKKADYALLALQFLATDGGASARAIAERYDIPVELLAKVLQHLARLGFVAAHKGAHGGYHLARSTAAISVAEVVQAIDGPFAVTACAPGDDRCAQFAACTVRDPLWRLKSRILSVLQTTTLAEIAKPRGSTVLLVNAR